MQKMGHVAGQGLGRHGQGITAPVSATGQTGASRGGVGSAAQKEAAIELSGEQQRAVDLVVNEGRNLFLTGCAGTGKSLVMRRITKQLGKVLKARGVRRLRHHRRRGGGGGRGHTPRLRGRWDPEEDGRLWEGAKKN